MSKQSEAKQAQGYKKNPDTCSNCAHFQSEIVNHTEYYGDWIKEKNKRCSVGGFAVGKNSTCNIHAPKEGSSA